MLQICFIKNLPFVCIPKPYMTCYRMKNQKKNFWLK